MNKKKPNRRGVSITDLPKIKHKTLKVFNFLPQCLNSYQMENALLIVSGIIYSRCLVLSRISTLWARLYTRAIYGVKRVHRFLYNRGVADQRVESLILSLFSSYRGAIYVDWTPVEKVGTKFEGLSWVWDTREKKSIRGYNVLFAALRYRSSFIPIGFRVFSSELCPKTQNQVEVEFILCVGSHIRGGYFVMDRGFAKGRVLGELDRSGIRFIVRGARAVGIRVGGERFLIGKRFRVERGDVRAYMETSKREFRFITIDNMRANGGVFYLITNLWNKRVEEVMRDYKRRPDIESLFELMKGEIGLEGFRVRGLGAIGRLLLLCVMACIVLFLVRDELKRKRFFRVNNKALSGVLYGMLSASVFLEFCPSITLKE